MILKVVKAETGEELLIEHDWHEPLPHPGDIMELHFGNTKRWKVMEIDWVFENAPPDHKEDIPVKCAVVLVSAPEDQDKEFIKHERPKSKMCKCGHPEEKHAQARCLGASGTCACTGFQDRDSTLV